MRVKLLVAAVLLGACASNGGKKEAEAPPRAIVLSVVATNDVHGQLERLPYMDGFVENLRRARANGGGVLLVDGGDAFQGTVESNQNEGHAIMQAYGEMGYAAMTLGNHEFDYGPVGEKSVATAPGEDPQGALRARIEEARFPVLVANLATTADGPPPWKHLSASTETLVAGVRVGIVGLLTKDAPDVIKRTAFTGLRVLPLADAAIREARSLRAKGAEVVVLVAHAGGECRSFQDPKDLSSCDGNSEIFELARAMPPGLVDAIIGGHRNANVAHVVNGVPVAHAASHLVAFSRIDLTLDPASHRVTHAEVFPPHPVCTVPVETGCRPGTYEGADVVPDPTTRAAVEPALAAARETKERPVGARVAEAFPVDRTHEMALGNLFADLMREAAPDANAAFGNAGSVRDVLPEGDLTYGRLLHVMPFDNQLARLRITGKKLRDLVRANVAQGDHGLLSLSGIRVEGTCANGALDIVMKHPDGAAIRDDESLVVVTNDFLALGGDGLAKQAGITDEDVEIDSGHTVFRALVEGLAKRGTVSPADPALLDPKHPRVKLPGELPVTCAGKP
ncbi:MAG TPA: 5'-nucleotidase C-terminal domain-containing protein [Polyangiaceae bacterium]|nr:5'-nucleotidase C-terminal domain-containing protein [Polyangiaceae bacterium]